ncbi:hypothetical protein Taro_048303 [Colocasia esculenta]|uniref:Uncharacterized protein n=1 Tax=Colocasia esculenta TaxID=4460 RepID=A0A843X860_COLES|nr:hypothetical protein [Colocasia esculenta]
MRLPLNTSSKSSDFDLESVQESKEGSECTSSSPTVRARFTCSFSDLELDELDDSELFGQYFINITVFRSCNF